MASGRNPKDWTIHPTGHGTGSITCGGYCGWYAHDAMARVQINWQDAAGQGLPPEIERAATEARVQADSGQQASQSGRLDAGG